MARLLIAALGLAGHKVEVVSELRSFTAALEPVRRQQIAGLAQQEADRLTRQWRDSGKPDLWFCYHPYYKAPDLIGPPLAAALNIPYVTAEASYSKRRDDNGWTRLQSFVVEAVRHAAVNICFTSRDEIGLAGHIPEVRLARLQPFIDVSVFRARPTAHSPHRLVTVAMMRSGDKLESYRMLAESLALLADRPWMLSVIGDGPEGEAVRAMFADFGAGRVEWLGQKQAGEIVDLLYQGGTFVWPGTGEAYGIAYLEAQAAGLPVVAQKTAGVPEVVKDGVTGALTAAGDAKAFADAIVEMLGNDGQRVAMGQAARRFVLEERSLEIASKRLDQLLREYVIHDR